MNGIAIIGYHIFSYSVIQYWNLPKNYTAQNKDYNNNCQKIDKIVK